MEKKVDEIQSEPVEQKSVEQKSDGKIWSVQIIVKTNTERKESGVGEEGEKSEQSDR